MDTAEKRKVFRKRLKDLSGTELSQWAFLVNLVQKVDTEMACYAALFGEESDLPTPDPQLAGIALAIQQELKRRSVAQAKLLQRLDTEGEENNHAENNDQNGH